MSKQKQDPTAGSQTLHDQVEDRDFMCDHAEILKLRREATELDEVYEDHKQMMQKYKQDVEVKKLEIKGISDVHQSFENFLKDEDANRALNRARDELEELKSRDDKEINRLMEEKTKLTTRKRDLELEVARTSVYADVLQRVCRLTKFNDLDHLTGYIVAQLHIRDKLLKREREVQEEIEQQRKELPRVQDMHMRLHLKMNNELHQLQADIEETRFEATVWEKEWNQIQETTAKKMLELCQIKMITLNLYETTGGIVGEGGIHVKDTEKQLEEIKNHMKDQEDILKLRKDFSSRRKDKGDED